MNTADAILLDLLGRQDAVWRPLRGGETLLEGATVGQLRRWWARDGNSVPGGGAATKRAAVSKQLRDLAARGLVELPAPGRARLSVAGESRARFLTGLWCEEPGTDPWPTLPATVCTLVRLVRAAVRDLPLAGPERTWPGGRVRYVWEGLVALRLAGERRDPAQADRRRLMDLRLPVEEVAYPALRLGWLAAGQYKGAVGYAIGPVEPTDADLAAWADACTAAATEIHYGDEATDHYLSGLAAAERDHQAGKPDPLNHLPPGFIGPDQLFYGTRWWPPADQTDPTPPTAA